MGKIPGNSTYLNSKPLALRLPLGHLLRETPVRLCEGRGLLLVGLDGVLALGQQGLQSLHFL